MAPRKAARSLKIKVLVIGYNRVGKTTIVNHLSNIIRGGQTYRKKGQTDVCMTSNSVKFMEATLFEMTNLRRLMIGTADAFILPYVTGDEESFRYVMTLINDVRGIKGKDVPLIVVSNKIVDDISPDIQAKNVRILTELECEKLDICSSMESSSQKLFSRLLEHYGHIVSYKYKRNNIKKKPIGRILRKLLCCGL